MLKESYIPPKEIRSRSGPPRRLAATQEPERKAVLNPAVAESLALRPSHTAGMTTKPGSANSVRRRSGGVMTGPSSKSSAARIERFPVVTKRLDALTFNPVYLNSRRAQAFACLQNQIR